MIHLCAGCFRGTWDLVQYPKFGTVLCGYKQESRFRLTYSQKSESPHLPDEQFINSVHPFLHSWRPKHDQWLKALANNIVLQCLNRLQIFDFLIFKGLSEKDLQEISCEDTRGKENGFGHLSKHSNKDQSHIFQLYLLGTFTCSNLLHSCAYIILLLLISSHWKAYDNRKWILLTGRTVVIIP